MGCIVGKSKKIKVEVNSPNKDTRNQRATKTLAHNEGIIDLYTLQQTLATLPYGKIVKAIHKRTNIIRSVKIMNLKKTQGIVLDDRHLFLEVDALSRLDHPNVLKIFDILHDDLRLFIVMEYWEGGLLFDKIRDEGVLTEKIAGKIIEQILSGVNYCHGNKVIHRDLNPKVIFMMNRQGTPFIKIGEYGSSVFIDPARVIEGKFDMNVYVAPEVADEDFNEKCDLWSVGVIMYVLLTGHSPFHENLTSICQESDKKKEINWKALAEQEISPYAIDLLQKLLEINFHNRISACEALSHNWFMILNKDEEKLNRRLTNALAHLSCYAPKAKLIDSIRAFIAKQVVNFHESKELVQVFKALDANWDGKLSKDELLKYYVKSLPEEEAKNVVNEIFNAADTDNSGFIEYTEFVKAAMEKDLLASKQHLEAAFQMIDCDHNGKISRQEVQSILNGTSLSGDKKWMKLLSLADKNNDGEIDMKEFYDLLLSFQ